MEPPPRRPATEPEAKALASAFRLRILRVCLDEPLTNKEIADRLGANPATTLHHVRKLVDTGFLAAQPARHGPRGGREIPYLASGKSWTLDVGPERADQDAMVEAFLTELHLVEDWREVRSSRLGLRLSEPEHAELVGRISELFEEFKGREPGPDARPYSLFFSVHPDVSRDRQPRRPAASSPRSRPAGNPSPR